MLGQVRKVKVNTVQLKPVAARWDIYRADSGSAQGMFFVCVQFSAQAQEINQASQQFQNTTNFKNLLQTDFNFQQVWTPEYSQSTEMIFDVNFVQFGGYQQAQKKGINGTQIIPKLVFKNIDDAQFKSILAFHEIYQTGAKQFYADIPLFKQGLRFKIDSFEQENINYNINQIIITLQEDFQPPFSFTQYSEIIEQTDI